MKKAFNKYFVVSLSFMLILSNFSYATQLMLCEMTGDTKACECKDKDVKKYDGITFNTVESKCCNEETSELSNTNTLLTNNNELNHDIYVNVTLFFNNNIDINHAVNSSVLYNPDKSHLPNLDIPILNSSLLI